MSKEFEFEIAGEIVDVRESVRRAVAIFAPALADREQAVAAYLAKWMRDGAGRAHWPAWANDVDSETLEAVRIRAFAWTMAEFRRRQITNPDVLKVFKLARIRPYVERCCDDAKQAADLHFAADDPPIVPLPQCRISPCLCMLETLMAADFCEDGAARIEITARNQTENGVVVTFILRGKI